MKTILALFGFAGVLASSALAQSYSIDSFTNGVLMDLSWAKNTLV